MKYLYLPNRKKAALRDDFIRIEFRMAEEDDFLFHVDVDGRDQVSDRYDREVIEYSGHRNRCWAREEIFGEVIDPDQKSRRGKLRCNDLHHRHYDRG